MENTNYGRNESKKSGSIDDEVQRLLRKNGKITSQDFMKLRSMYKDDEIVNKIQNSYIAKQSNILKKAKKFAELIREKYSQSQTPFHILLEKAHKYKVKYGLTDEEFSEFQRIYEQELVGIKSVEVVQPSTNLQKVLGNITLEYQGFASKLDVDDSKYLQEIVNHNAVTKALHAQVLLQSLKYMDCDFEALSGSYDRNIHKIGDYVHPVIVALFLPKLKVVEEHFLFSNIANVVKCRYNGEPLLSRPDYELFYALTTDPNDVVCDSKSTVLDLLNRSRLQAQLWNSVLHLRNGQYYQPSFRDFINSVDTCKLNKQDTPDFVYGRFDGVILKRLLSAFSFRPTVVSTLPAIMNTVALNPYSMNVRPQVTSVPMINMRIPPQLNGAQTPINLNSAIEQYQFFIENGQIVPRNTSLIWSRGVLIFYVDRRATSIKLNNQLEQFSMSRLPASIAGFERLNNRPVEFDENMYIGPQSNEAEKEKNKFSLRSVVFSEVNVDSSGQETNYVIGSSALIRYLGPEGNSQTAEYICYDPYAPLGDQGGNSRSPMRKVFNGGQQAPQNDFGELAKTKGTIFIYASRADTDKVMELYA
jgi:hypothetical protein